MEDIPNQFIERQLNDSRYISKFIKSLLSNIVREEGEEEATSKKCYCLHWKYYRPAKKRLGTQRCME